MLKLNSCVIAVVTEYIQNSNFFRNLNTICLYVYWYGLEPSLHHCAFSNTQETKTSMEAWKHSKSFGNRRKIQLYISSFPSCYKIEKEYNFLLPDNAMCEGLFEWTSVSLNPDSIEKTTFFSQERHNKRQVWNVDRTLKTFNSGLTQTIYWFHCIQETKYELNEKNVTWNTQINRRKVARGDRSFRKAKKRSHAMPRTGVEGPWETHRTDVSKMGLRVVVEMHQGDNP